MTDRFRFCARRDGNHLLFDHQPPPLQFLCTQRRKSLVGWSVTTATSVSAHAKTEVGYSLTTGLSHATMITLLFEEFNIDFLHPHTTRYFRKQDIRNGCLFPVPSFFKISRIFHCQIGSTLEKQFSPSLWEILLWALIPHQKTPCHSINKHADLLINRSMRTVKTMDQTSYWIFLQALWSIR